LLTAEHLVYRRTMLFENTPRKIAISQNPF